jgi:hypothetical protein
MSAASWVRTCLNLAPWWVRGWGRSVPPCRHGDRSLSSDPSKRKHPKKRLLTSKWRSPAFSLSRVRRMLWWRPTPPLPHSRTPPRRPSVDRLVAGAPAPAPGACSFAASAALGEGGRRLPPLRGARPPSLSSSSPSPDDEYSEVAGGESPCCSRIWCSSSLCSRCSRRRILRSLLRTTRSCSCRCAARACARALGVGGSDRAAFTATLCWEE